jgi:hypothetical protein
MTTYYHTRDLQITDEWITGTDGSCPLDAVDDYWTAPSYPGANAIRRMVMLVVGTLCTITGIFGLLWFADGHWKRVGFNPFWEFVASYSGFVLVTVGVVVLGRALDPSPGPGDLWVRCGGTPIRVAASLSGLELGKAHRALRRARERNHVE